MRHHEIKFIEILSALHEQVKIEGVSVEKGREREREKELFSFNNHTFK